MLVKWQPFGTLLSHDSFLEDFFNESFPVRTATFEPKIDVKETDKNFEINAELPGLNKDDFKLTVEDDLLTLVGEKKYEHEDKDGDYYRSERSYGAFKRYFRLTNAVDRKKISADYKNGILKVILPKAKEAKPKEIEININ